MVRERQTELEEDRGRGRKRDRQTERDTERATDIVFSTMIINEDFFKFFFGEGALALW